MGMNPDTTLVEDLFLIQRSVDEFGRTVGIQPSKEVIDEFKPDLVIMYGDIYML